jgi:hypothetical protein
MQEVVGRMEERVFFVWPIFITMAKKKKKKKGFWVL